MQVLNSFDTLQVLCKSTCKWGMYISFFVPEHEEDEAELAAPYLNLEKHMQIIIDGNGYLLFDTKEEMEEKFWMTVGDDGPTETNKYDGGTRVYALTCGPDGQLLNENT